MIFATSRASCEATESRGPKERQHRRRASPTDSSVSAGLGIAPAATAPYIIGCRRCGAVHASTEENFGRRPASPDPYGVTFMTTAIEEFWATIDRVYGTYLDANAGFAILGARIRELQSQEVVSSGSSREHLDTRSVFYGKGDPNSPDAVVQHKVAQGRLKARNRKNGENAQFLGAMSVVSIYQFWEDRFRNEIAAELGVLRQDLKHDLFGDLRLIRIAIIHHGGAAKKEIERCVLLRWFREGDEIILDEGRVFELITRLRGVCLQWMAQRDAGDSEQ